MAGSEQLPRISWRAEPVEETGTADVQADVEADADAPEEAAASAPEKRSSFATAAFGTMATAIIMGVLALANVILTSRYLGPSGRGQLAFLTTMTAITATLATLGVEEAHANLAGREPHHRPALAKNSVVLSLLFGRGAALLVLATIAVFPAVGADTSLALCAFVLAFVPIIVLQMYLRLLVQADYGFLAANVGALLAPVVNITVNGLFAIVGLLTVSTAVATWAIGQAAGTVVLIVYIAKRLAGFGRWDRTLAKRSLAFGAKAHLGHALKTGNYRLDVWLVGAIAGDRQVGLYSVAVAWTEALFFLPDALTATQRPDLVRSGRQEAGERSIRTFRAATLLTAPLVVLLMVAAPFLCVTIYGKQFTDSVIQLRVLAPGAFGMVAMKIFANTLTAQRKPMLANAGLGIALGVTVALDILLIPHHGGLGASIASTAAYTIGGAVIAGIFIRAVGARGRALAPRLDDVRDILSLIPRRSRRAG